MATNKRKEAAALFELIDKSTLKVPKNAGALKIPSWWSSKSNPPAPGEAEAHANGHAPQPPAASTASPAPHGQMNGQHKPPTTMNGQANGHARPLASPASEPPKPLSAPQARMPAASPPAAPQSAPAPAAAPQDTSAQHRLFDPPPAHAPAPPTTPSIRPPAPHIAAPVIPTVKAPPPHAPAPLTPAPSPPPPAPTATTIPVEAIEDEPLDEPAPPPEKASPARPFAPQTHAQTTQSGRKLWTPPRAGSGLLARNPGLALIAGAAAVVLVICMLVLVFRPGRSNAPANDPSASNGSQTAPPQNASPSPDGRGFIPPPAPGQTAPPQQGNAGGLTAQHPPQHTTPGGARVYMPGEAQRSPELFYIIIAQTPEKAIAERNAQHLARNGIDVSIESMPRGMYGLVTVQGFRTAAEGEAVRKQIITLGRQLKGNWNDAFFTRVRKPQAAG